MLTMFLGSFTLVTAEFLPPGVLTALATDLEVPDPPRWIFAHFTVPVAASYARSRWNDEKPAP
ncbi:hypothetical protein AB0M13_25070 [Nocardia fluminea]|uniref:hypothetical protein n=1 Tax=Nocardia fluminea TaxID=134984 RepID=UPI003426AA32